MQRSGFWIRTAATAIDAIVFLIFVVTIAVTELVLEQRGTLTDAKETMLSALLFVLWIAYSSLEVIAGATVGKMLTGIVIATPNGAPAPPWTRVLRWSTKQSGMLCGWGYVISDSPILYYVGGLLNSLLMIGCLRALGEDKQTWHDLWSHTAVVPRKAATQMREVREEPEGVPPPT